MWSTCICAAQVASRAGAVSSQRCVSAVSSRIILCLRRGLPRRYETRRAVRGNRGLTAGGPFFDAARDRPVRHRCVRHDIVPLGWRGQTPVGVGGCARSACMTGHHGRRAAAWGRRGRRSSRRRSGRPVACCRRIPLPRSRMELGQLAVCSPFHCSRPLALRARSLHVTRDSSAYTDDPQTAVGTYDAAK
jgi:hypothetical protein